MPEVACLDIDPAALRSHLVKCPTCRSARSQLIDLAVEILRSIPDTGPIRTGSNTLIINRHHVLAPDTNPAAESLMFRDFVKTRFESDVLQHLKKTGRTPYDYSLHRHILPVIGDFRLSEITFEMIQEGLVQKMLDAGYTVQTAREARRVAHTVFRHALRVRCFIGHPPTIGTRFPAVRRKRTSALTISQATAVLKAFRNPFKSIALVSMTMGMSLSEVTALRWKCINLSSAPIFCDGEMIPAHSAAVRETFHRGSFGVPRTESRRRCLPLPEAVARELLAYRITAKFSGPDDIVFATRNGTPYLLSYLHDRIKEVGRDLGLPWLSWSCFRNTHAMLAQQLGVSLSDRQAQMGLAAAWMMERYPDSEIELQRVGGEAIARKVT